MRRVSLLIAAFLFVSVSTVLGQLPANELEGTWEMVSQKLVYPDSTVDRTDQVPYTLKILNSTHFAFGRQIAEEDIYAGGGTYTYDGESYTEHIEYHSAAGLAGTSIKFDARLEDGVWHHSGDLGDFVLEEVWRKVQKQRAVGTSL